MPFVITVVFATEHDRDDFIERGLPRTRAKQAEADPALADETAGMSTVTVSVTSASAARDLCSQIVAFLAHAKGTRVDVRWTGVQGEPAVGEVSAGAARDAEVLAVRLGAAAHAHLAAEKAVQNAPDADTAPASTAE